MCDTYLPARRDSVGLPALPGSPEWYAFREVERYIAAPGQALSCKIGERKLRELRTRAEQALGPKFDIRAFHDEVLVHGSVPLNVPEAAVDRWLAAQK